MIGLMVCLILTSGVVTCVHMLCNLQRDTSPNRLAHLERMVKAANEREDRLLGDGK